MIKVVQNHSSWKTNERLGHILHNIIVVDSIVSHGIDRILMKYSGLSTKRVNVSRILDHHAHYNDVIMGPITSQITSLTIVYSIIYSDADQRKHQNSASLAFVWGIHRGPVNFPHKWPVTRKMFPFDDVIMWKCWWPGGVCLVPRHLCHLCHQPIRSHVRKLLSANSNINSKWSLLTLRVNYYYHHKQQTGWISIF